MSPYPRALLARQLTPWPLVHSVGAGAADAARVVAPAAEHWTDIAGSPSPAANAELLH